MSIQAVFPIYDFAVLRPYRTSFTPALYRPGLSCAFCASCGPSLFPQREGTSGYLNGHGLSEQRQLSPSSGVGPKSIVDLSGNVTSRPLKTRAVRSFAGHPEIVIGLPG